MSIAQNLLALFTLSTLILSWSGNAIAVIQDTSISGAPPNSEITLFGSDKSISGSDKTVPKDSGTVVQTDGDGQFHFNCVEGQRYRIGSNDGKGFDSFICRSGGLVCLADANAITRPVIQDLPISEKASEKTKDALSGFAKGMLGMGGGGFGMGAFGGGKRGTSMIKKPRGPWQPFTSGNSGIELRGWIYHPRSKKKKPEIRIGLRVKDSPDQGAPHRMILQHQSGRLIMPTSYMVFEIWAHWKLTITVTKESYVNGELVSRSVTRSSYSWKELMERYATILELPAIWEKLGGDKPKAFGKFRGVLAQFPLPENFNPAEWSLVSHITSKAKISEIPASTLNMVIDQRKKPTAENQEVLLTIPFIINLGIKPGKKQNLDFVAAPDHRTFYQQHHDCPIQPLMKTDML